MSMQRCSAETRVYEGDLAEEALLCKPWRIPPVLRSSRRWRGPSTKVCVCDFTAGLDLNQSTVSHHLKLLKDAGLVTSERRGTWSYYTLAPDARERLDAALHAVLPTKVPA